MEWPQTLPTSSELFPSFSTVGTHEGLIPSFPSSSPVFALLDPESSSGIKTQLSAALASYKGPIQDPRSAGATVDEHLGKVVIAQSAIVEPGAHFIGPCYVGPGAEIRHGAYVRPFSWICSGAVVGHASEVKHSILLPGAKAPHFNYVGDSILGTGVNLGAGTKISNLRNDGGEVHLRLSGQRMGSGLRKFGAILGEGCQLGCNSVTNPGVILGRNSSVMPNTTVTGVHAPESRHG